MSDEVLGSLGVPKHDIIEAIKAVDSMNHTSELLQHDEVDEALWLILEVIKDPNLSQDRARKSLVFLTAVYAKLKIDIRSYMTLDKTAPRAAEKKNVSISLADAIMELIASLKYLVRS